MTSARDLPGAALFEAFPCHLWLDAQLRVVQLGPVLARLAPDLIAGNPAFACIELVRPMITPIAVTLRTARDQVVVRHRATNLCLQGQVIGLEDNTLILLLNPSVSADQDLADWGLTRADFPTHAGMSELETQHRIARHLRQTPLAVIDWDPDGRIATWNPAATRIFGIAEDQAIGRGPEILGVLGLADRPAPGHEHPNETKPASFDLLGILDRRVVVEHRTPTGATILCAWHNTLLVDLEANPIGVSSILRDVTESVRSERATREAQKFESLGLLAGGVAHDFNNMLAALLGNAELALLDAEPGSALARRLGEITAIAERATTMTKQLLDYSGRATYGFDVVALTDLLAETRMLLTSQLDPRIRLTVRDESPLSIQGDAAQLREVLLTLVFNAAEAIGDRDGTIRVSTSRVTLAQPVADPAIDAGVHGGPLAPGSYVRLEVEDDGAGMSPELLSRIFDPFFSTKFMGRGLGLAAMLGIVRGHGGALRVESRVGCGSRFELLFPAARPAQSRAVTKPATRGRRLGNKGRLLVVDDEAPVRRVLSTALSGAGFDVVTAEAGNAALELYDNDPTGFDLVLTDLTMPGLDGHQLFTALTTRDPQLPVILSSGYSEHQHTARYPDGTPATFLKKPYRLGYLLAKVNEELGKREAS